MTVRSRVNERVWAAVEDSDVVVVYPHQHLAFDETSGEAQVRLNRERGGIDG